MDIDAQNLSDMALQGEHFIGLSPDSFFLIFAVVWVAIFAVVYWKTR